MARRARNLTIVESTTPSLTFSDAVETFVRDLKVRHLSPVTIKWHQDSLHTLDKLLTEQGLPTEPHHIPEQISALLHAPNQNTFAGLQDYTIKRICRCAHGTSKSASLTTGASPILLVFVSRRTRFDTRLPRCTSRMATIRSRFRRYLVTQHWIWCGTT